MNCPNIPTQVVYKVEDGMNPKDIYCTTYQMRNVYEQVATACISSLDVMSLLLHHSAALFCKPGDKVLDVCCGRAMTLPLLRRLRPNILTYVGVDIKYNNFAEAYRKSATTKIQDKKFAPNHNGSGENYYPFPINFVEADVAEMYEPLKYNHHTPFDKVIYTAAIEHMQKEAGIKSLEECFKCMRKGATMFLTTPNTRFKKDPYDTQYAAHLYEWDRDEILTTCVNTLGFELIKEYGLLAKVRGYEDNLREIYPELVDIFLQMKECMPSAWLYATFPILTPLICDEIAFIFRRPVK